MRVYDGGLLFVGDCVGDILGVGGGGCIGEEWIRVTVCEGKSKRFLRGSERRNLSR